MQPLPNWKRTEKWLRGKIEERDKQQRDATKHRVFCWIISVAVIACAVWLLTDCSVADAHCWKPSPPICLGRCSDELLDQYDWELDSYHRCIQEEQEDRMRELERRHRELEREDDINENRRWYQRTR